MNANKAPKKLRLKKSNAKPPRGVDPFTWVTVGSEWLYVLEAVCETASPWEQEKNRLKLLI
jgi:hypothetical protein